MFKFLVWTACLPVTLPWAILFPERCRDCGAPMAYEAPASIASAPAHVRACVRISGCGGLVVSSGPQWSRVLTARHCYRGAKLGDKFDVTFVDGSKSKATLLTTDHRYDLAMLAVPTKDVLASVKLAKGRPDKGRYEAVGWPQRCSNGVCRQVLTYFLLRPDPQKPYEEITGESDQFDGKPAWRWRLIVDQGGNTPGASGMPVFCNGQFVGINSNNNGHNIGTICFAAYPEQIETFIATTEHKTKGSTKSWNMGAWSEPSINFKDAPPALGYGAASSNRPLELSQNAPQIPDAPPAPDGGHDATPIQSRRDPRFSDEVYDGHGRPPKDLNSPRKRSAEIDRLRHQAPPEFVQPPPIETPPPPPADEELAPPIPVQKKQQHFPLNLAAGFAAFGLVHLLGIGRRIRKARG